MLRVCRVFLLAALVLAGSKGPIHDQCRNAKDSQCHRGHYIKLPNDPNAKDTQWLAPSCSPEKEHDDSSRNQNNSTCEIHSILHSTSAVTISQSFLGRLSWRPHTSRPYSNSTTSPSRNVTRRSMREANSMLWVAMMVASPEARTSCVSAANTWSAV